MERRIGELKVEKDCVISTVKSEFIQSAKQSGKDKVITIYQFIQRSIFAHVHTNLYVI